jgi:hypothetical protein
MGNNAHSKGTVGMSIKKNAAKLLLSAALACMAEGTAQATTYNFSSGVYGAQAVFTTNGAGNLQVTLSNTSTSDVLIPINVLTGLFWSGTSGLTPLSATLPTGSAVLFGAAPGGNVGGEWAFASGLAGAPGSATQGISSAGLGLFGAGNFGGSNLQGPNAVNGLQYGITSAGDNPLTGNTPVTGPNALIQNSVAFTLLGTVNLASITNVWFQYGTALNEPHFAGNLDPVVSPVPVPATLPLLAAGIGAFGFCRRFKKRAA